MYNHVFVSISIQTCIHTFSIVMLHAHTYADALKSMHTHTKIVLMRVQTCVCKHMHSMRVCVCMNVQTHLLCCHVASFFDRLEQSSICYVIIPL